MEINLITRNGITPNPTVEFLELCQLAIDALNSDLFSTIILLNKVKELSTPNSYLILKQLSYYGVTCYFITYSVQGTHIKYDFSTHQKTGDFTYELYPSIHEYTTGIPNE